MTIKIKSFKPFSGGGTYTDIQFFGGDAIGPAILNGDVARLKRKVLVLEDGFASLTLRGRFRIDRDEEGKFVESGVVKSLGVSQRGEGVVQKWTGLNWSVNAVDKVIRRAERGDDSAFTDFLNGFKYSWTLAPSGRQDGWVQASFNDDRIKGSNTSDVIFSMGGNDRVQARGGADDVWAGTGDDQLFGGGGNDLLRGQEGDDRLIGGKGGDNLQGGGGDDIARGGGGDDFVRGEWDGAAEAGDDRLYGDRGNDQISGGGGNDLMWGGPGDDRMGGDDGVRAREPAGDDQMWGGAGRDVMEGGKGDDMIYGGEGDDMIYGGAGNDVISGGEGDDALRGEGGADVFDFRGENLGFDTADIDIGRDFRLEGFPLVMTDRLQLDVGGRAELAFIDDPDPDAFFGSEILVLRIFAPDGLGGERQTGAVELFAGLLEEDLPAAQALIDDSIL